jgi:hypothetical protein
VKLGLYEKPRFTTLIRVELGSSKVKCSTLIRVVLHFSPFYPSFTRGYSSLSPFGLIFKVKKIWVMDSPFE